MAVFHKLAGLAALFLAASPVHAQGGNFEIPSAYTQWDNEDWTLSTTELHQGQYQSRMGLANGYFGCALAAAGPFFEAEKNLTDPNGLIPVNGWPLDNPRKTFCSLAFFWNSQRNTTRTNFAWLLQYGGESVISGVPHWGSIIFDFNGAHLDADVANDTIVDFRSTLSAQHGIGTWSYTWAPKDANGLEFEVDYTVFVSRERPNVAAVRAKITPSADARGTVTDLLDGRSADRTTFASKVFDNRTQSIRSAVHPVGLPNITAVIESRVKFEGEGVELASRRQANQDWVPSENEATIGQTYNVNLRAGQTLTVYKFVGAASTDAFANPVDVACREAQEAEETGWGALLDEHEAAWERILPKETVDDYSNPDGSLPEDVNVRDMHISSAMTPFYLLQNTQAAPLGSRLADHSISVAGLTGEAYAGWIFWDADLWMSPGLLISHPEYARQIANYRIVTAPRARQNAVENGFSEGSILYPWISGRFGNCTAAGPCTDYQYHLNADIAQMLLQNRNVTGDEEWWRENAWPIYDGVAQMFSELLQYNGTTRKYDIRNHTDPDEYANGIDNGAFTLAAASKVLTTANYFRSVYGQDVNETWDDIANNVAIPYDDSGITIEYEGMNNSVPIKQADVILSTYPFDYRNNYTEEQSLMDLDYYAGKQSPDGPAMTYSILSIVANQVSPSGCSAYTYSLNAFEPFTRAPWYQFSEQQIDVFVENGGTNPAFPFLTGHGGFHQVGPFGWLGARTDRAELLIDPALPPQIRQVRLRTMYFSGATLNVFMNYTHTTITRVETTNDFVKDTYGSNPMPIQQGEEEPRRYEVSIGETIYVENRLYTSNLTVANNLVQCLPAESDDPIRPGQYALAAIDGAISTTWQPSTSERASMVIDMSSVPIQPVVGVAFNWGTTPPVSANVILSNSSSFEGPAVSIPIENITISEPFNPDVADVRPFVGNSTNLAVASASGAVYTGKYAKLEIEGTQGPNTENGGSVAEFSLIGAGGSDSVKDWQQVQVA